MFPFFGFAKFLPSRDLAIDLGTANTLIYDKEKGIVLNEPSIVAVSGDKGYTMPYLYGEKAKMMLGKTPLNISIHKPLQDGVIADFRIAEAMIKNFVKTVSTDNLFFRPRIIVCVPFEATDVERRAIQAAVEKCGAKQVLLIEEPMAAAIGADLSVTEPIGSMIVDIGGGTSEIAVISLGGIVYGRSVKVGGDAMDRAIYQYIRQKHNLLIGCSTAERIKKEVGVAFFSANNDSGEKKIRGRDLISGTPKEITISEESICNALSEPVSQIVEAVKMSLESVPPELASDIVDRGIVLTGGGAMLKNMDCAIGKATGLPVFLAPSPLYCVALGAGKVLQDVSRYANILFKQS